MLHEEMEQLKIHSTLLERRAGVVAQGPSRERTHSSSHAGGVVHVHGRSRLKFPLSFFDPLNVVVADAAASKRNFLLQYRPSFSPSFLPFKCCSEWAFLSSHGHCLYYNVERWQMGTLHLNFTQVTERCYDSRVYLAGDVSLRKARAQTRAVNQYLHSV